MSAYLLLCRELSNSLSARATALPNATCLASSFSTDLVHEAGGLLAVEAQARGAVCLLDPTVNIQRSPAGGRAFESFSEDPTVSGHVAAAYIQGLQAGGVSATIKHFVANDQEHERNGVNVVVAQRPLREVYLRPFQIAEKVAKPWAYMTSYSRLNGTHCSENPWLLKTLLRDEWGSDALVMSDWLGTYSATEAINAGLTLEMPGPTMWRSRRMIETLLSAHKIKPEALDARAAEVVAWVQKLAKINPELAFGPKGEEKTREDSRDKDGPLLRRLAGEGAVLLKNEGVLPLRTGKVAIIGPNAKAAVVTGGGSAQLRSAWTVSPWQGLEGTAPDGVELSYSLGCVSAKFLPILGEDFTTPDGKPGFALNHYAIVDGQVAAEPAVRDTHDVSKMLLADFRHPALGQHYVTEILATFTAPITGEYEFGVVVSGQGWLYVDDKLVIDNSTDQVMGESFFNNGTIEVRGTTKVEKGKVSTVHRYKQRQLTPFAEVQHPLRARLALPS
jgi:beta-glucosidase